MVKTTPRQVQCRNLFEAAGFARSGASALVGNFAVESGANLATAYRAAGHLDHGSQGLAQWRLGRLTSMQNFILSRHSDAGPTTWFGNMGEQVAFVIHELETDYPALNAKLRKGGDPAALAADVCWQYERPNKALSHIADRVAYAKLLAAATSPNPTGEGPTIGVVDHLQAAANTEHMKAQGGVVLAALGGVGAAATVGSNFVEGLPTWEWIGIGVALLAFVVGMIGHLSSTNKARSIEQAATGVTPNAPPAEIVDHTPVPVPEGPPVPVPDEVTLDERIARAVAAALAQQAIGQRDPVAQPQLRSIQIAGLEPDPHGGATMGIVPGVPVQGAV
jgi:hypothetical protein